MIPKVGKRRAATGIGGGRSAYYFWATNTRRKERGDGTAKRDDVAR